jgi:hypothetical protein
MSRWETICGDANMMAHAMLENEHYEKNLTDELER